jgi:hypothetical protein
MRLKTFEKAEKNELIVFEKKILKTIFGPVKVKETGE